MSALSDLLRTRQEGRSLRELRDRAQRRGHSIGHATIGLYLSALHPEPSEPTLKALAAAFGVSLRAVREAAGVNTETAPFALPAEADRLSRRQRAAVVEVVRAMLEPVDAIVSTRAVAEDGGSEEAVDARPDSAGRSRARRSEPSDPPPAPRQRRRASEGRSR